MQNIRNVYRNMGAQRDIRYPTNLVNLDRLFNGGLQQGSLVGIVGRPEIESCLSSFTIQLALSFAQVAPTVVMSAAMEPDEIYGRLDLLGVEDKSYGPGTGLAVFDCIDFNTDEIEDLAWLNKVVIIDGLHKASLRPIRKGPPSFSLIK